MFLTFYKNIVNQVLIVQQCFASRPIGQTLFIKQILNVWPTMFDRLATGSLVGEIIRVKREISLQHRRCTASSARPFVKANEEKQKLLLFVAKASRGFAQWRLGIQKFRTILDETLIFYKKLLKLQTSIPRLAKMFRPWPNDQKQFIKHLKIALSSKMFNRCSSESRNNVLNLCKNIAQQIQRILCLSSNVL